MRASSLDPKRRSTTGFTLIELLVVIAIIAILAAILLPVFATVRENARASNSMSNMHAISTGLAQFDLDHHSYPDVLFGYAVPGASMDNAFDTAQAAGTTATYFPGLYPEYVKDYRLFTDPNNTVAFSATVAVPVNFLCPSAEVACTAGTDDGKLMPSSKTFYKADAYDSSPAISGVNALDPGTFVARYQSSWTDINGSTFDCSNSAATAPLCGGPSESGKQIENLYTHQLRWKNPPDVTYVTSTTYHVQQSGNVLALWQNGSVRKVGVATFLQCSAAISCNNPQSSSSTTSEAGQSSVAVSGGVSSANFWKLNPTGP